MDMIEPMSTTANCAATMPVPSEFFAVGVSGRVRRNPED